MTLLCGIDFSANSIAAAHAAAAIAKRRSASLSLIHVMSSPTLDGLAHDGEKGPLYDPLLARLRATADDISKKAAIRVDAQVDVGEADEVLVRYAKDLGADLIVVSSLGARKQQRWLLGSVAERVSQSSPVPVLVVRDGARLQDWAGGGTPLRVLVGVEVTLNAKRALDWAIGLAAIGKVDVTVTHIAWPLADASGPASGAPLPLDRLRPETERALLSDLQKWAALPSGAPRVSFTVRPGLGRVDSHLVQVAEEIRADLVVVGTHQSAGLARLWQGSVSRGVLHGAAMNVACIPKGS